MKGIILDFSNENQTGVILAEDGSRYIFKSEEWKSKNKSPDIDTEIDFIIKDNKAIEIFSLNKNNINKFDNLSSSFKKIDFDKIEEENRAYLESNPNLVKQEKIKYIKYFFISSGLTLVTFILSQILYEIKWSGIGGILTILFVGGCLITILIFLLMLYAIFVPKKTWNEFLKNDKILTEYKEQVKIINYIPNNLKFEDCGMIHAVADNYDDAIKELIEKAFKLKADGIFNFKQNSDAYSDIKTKQDVPFLTPTQIKTNVVKTYRLEGIAVKFS